MKMRTSQKGGIAMPTVKIGRSRQVTIPKRLFEELGLREGDYVEVDRQGHQIILTPKVLINREKVKAELFELIDQIRERNKNLKPEDVKKAISQALSEVRGQKEQS
jgi:AbrB family looped-hinge helix DNA binding protein